MKKFSTVSAYFAAQPASVRAGLHTIQRIVTREAPDAVELLSYDMPAFKLNKKILIYYAAWQKHIALYALPRATAAFKKELTPYRTSKGTIQFALDSPLPVSLIRKIVKFRVTEILAS